MSATTRFKALTRAEANGCWQWIGAIDSGGYASFYAGGITRVAHKWYWELLNGQVPEGLELDHLCRNRTCVNPKHLEPVTHLENVKRGLVAQSNSDRAEAITHCPKGHAYTKANTQTYRANRGGGMCRRCRTCKNDADRARRKAA